MYMYIKTSLFISFIIVILNCILLSQGAPRGPTDTAGIADDLKPIGKLAYSIENAPQQFSAAATATDAKSQSTAVAIGENSNFISILNRFFEKNDIISSLFHLISKASEDQQKQELYGDKFLKENERIKNDAGKQATERLSRISAVKTSESRKAIQLDEPIDSFNIDSAPAEFSKQDSKLPSLDNEWKSTLFGPKGMLTEVFRFVNEKRKQGFEKAALPQSDLPPPTAIGDSNKFDFPKIFDALMKSPGNGFDDSKIPEIPFIGICNRLNCGDIYKAVDQFKKSELFSNFQTAISLIQDPKGWDVIEELLQNPELIEQYIGKSGGGNIQGLLGKATNSGSGKKPSSTSSLSVLPSDGDLGIDFTNEIDGGVLSVGSGGNDKSVKVETSIDSGSDYYTSVDKTKPSIDYDYEGAETVDVEEVIGSSKIVDTKVGGITTTATAPYAPSSLLPPKKEEPPLPELSFSVDETPETISSSIDTDPDYGSAISIDEKLPSSSKNEIGLKKPQQLNALERRFVLSSTSTTTAAQVLTTLPPSTTTTMSRKGTTTTTQKPRKNFRRSDDYYSMYYDNN